MSDPLKFWRDHFLEAESRLAGARESLRKAAQCQNVPTDGLFSGSMFVKRTTAESWLADAEREHSERERENADAVRAALTKLAKDKGDSYSQDGDSPDGIEDQTEPGKKAKRSKKTNELDDQGYDAPRTPPAPDSAAVQAAAAAIIRAGQIRRNEIPNAPGKSQPVAPRLTVVRETVVPGAVLPPKGSIARAILDAGKRRRGEPVEDD